MNIYGSLLVLLSAAIASLCDGVTLSTYLTHADRSRFKSTFSQAHPYTNLLTTHYAFVGQQLLGETVPQLQDACQLLETAEVKTPENAYYAAGIAKIAKCKVVPEWANVLNRALDENSPSVDLYFAVFGLKNMGQPVDSGKVSKFLTAAIKRDDSVLSMAYAFHIASQLTIDVTSFVDRIEDVAVQADEVDGKYAQFEGGLSVTALAVSGIYRLAEKHSKTAPIEADKCVKFANYLLSRKNVGVPRAAFMLLDTLTVLTRNKFHVPVAVTLASNIAVSAEEPNVQVRVTNVVGASAFGAMTVALDSAKLSKSNAEVASNKAFQPVAQDNSLYQLNFLEHKPSKGFYTLSLSAKPTKADPRLLGNVGAEVQVKVLTSVVVDYFEIATVDIDQTTGPQYTRVSFPQKLAAPLEADSHQKLVAKFLLKDSATGQAITLHQVFVRLTHDKSQQEIIFIAESDATSTYKFDIDLNAKSKDFGHLSGDYRVDLIIGDAVISNPFVWRVGTARLSFADSPAEAPHHLSRAYIYSKKPEIKHLFREPEKTPAVIVSLAFTAVTLLPLAFLLIHWMALGANLSNFKFSISSLGFFTSLSSIFVLFFYFWWDLNMFTTLKCLAGTGSITFLFGNYFLRAMADARKAKSS